MATRARFAARMTGPAPEDPKLLGRIAVVAEVVIIITASSLLARELAEAFALPTRADREPLLFAQSPPDWLGAAGVEASWLGLRFGIALALAWLVCAWVGGPSRRLAGLSFGTRSLFALIGFGLLLGLLLNAPILAIDLAQRALGIGETTDMWRLIRASEWTPHFWLYMAVGSYALVPLAEELLFRAYVLGRFRMHFSAGAAVLLSAALFWVSHGQYLRADPFLLTYSALTFAGAAVLAWSVIRTGSIVPALTAHAFMNVPTTEPFMIALIAAALVALVVWRRSIWTGLKDFAITVAGAREWIFLGAMTATLLAGALIIRAIPATLMPLLAAFLTIALIGLIRRAPWTRRTDQSSTQQASP